MNDSLQIDDYSQITPELVRAGLAAGNRVRLSVTGDSMAPFLRRGDAVWAEPASVAGLRRGDLVVVQRQRELVTHRVVKVDGAAVYTKGDNVSYLDAPVAVDAIVGRVVAVERRSGRMELEGRSWRVANRLLGLLGWWEIRVFQMGRRVKRRLFGPSSGPATRILSHLIVAPLRGLSRLILR